MNVQTSNRGTAITNITPRPVAKLVVLSFRTRPMLTVSMVTKEPTAQTWCLKSVTSLLDTVVKPVLLICHPLRQITAALSHQKLPMFRPQQHFKRQMPTSRLHHLQLQQPFIPALQMRVRVKDWISKHTIWTSG